jgi:hypothetical protein
MVIAQELIGRPYLIIYGIKATTMVWILIALFLGLIFSMTLWPGLWRKIYHYHKQEKPPKEKVKWHETFKFIPWQLALIVIIIAIFSFIAGSFLGFTMAFDNVVKVETGCQTTPCSSFNFTCPNCICSLCSNALKVTIPLGTG